MKVKLKITATFVETIETEDWRDQYLSDNDVDDGNSVDSAVLEEFAIRSFTDDLDSGGQDLNDLDMPTIEVEKA